MKWNNHDWLLELNSTLTLTDLWIAAANQILIAHDPLLTAINQILILMFVITNHALVSDPNFLHGHY